MAAFTLNSDTHSTKSRIRDLFLFLSDFKNFEAILPEDKVEDFNYGGDRCSFTIKGMTAMSIVRKEKIPHSKLVFNSEGLAKFNFELTVWFNGAAEQQGQCRVDLLADMNPIIKMMAEKPLLQLINTMSRKLSELELTPDA